MDPSASSRKRRQEPPHPAKPPIRIPARDKRRAKADTSQARAAGKTRAGPDSREDAGPSRPRREVSSPVDGDASARNFAVTNIGPNGTLYLKPSRMPQPVHTIPSPTPPQTSHGLRRTTTDLSSMRGSNTSALTTRLHAPRGASQEPRSIPVPPLSLANNGHSRRRTRSHSFSSISDQVRAPTYDSAEFQILVHGAETNTRPKSSMDLGSSGILDLRIPHYRLGTPRFSERGTAYLHYSQYTSASEDVHSSVYSRTELDKLFPVPPHGNAGLMRRTSSGPFLQPSHAASSRTSRIALAPSARTTIASIIPMVFDRIEAAPNDPSFVRYSATDGRIVAATPARLVAQITSPQFLDYELLSDFFLTYRVFISSHDLLELLMLRMRWALDSSLDSGRIVRVRTFVALRHWILNYFQDDFVGNHGLRERLCTAVNEQCRALMQRADKDGSDLNILGELKKCWRRTCASHWPSPDAMDTSATADIVPGGEEPPTPMQASAVSLPLSLRQGWRDSHRPMSESIGPDELRNQNRQSEYEARMRAFGPERMSLAMQRASIPTSPMSEDSLEVLSCSVPFLRHLIPSSYGLPPKGDKPRNLGSQKNPPLSGRKGRTTHQHKRSGSFSDALRDQRTPLPSPKPDSVDIHSLPAVTFTGGLVRGLLLQPSPSKVDLIAPISPVVEAENPFSDSMEDTAHSDRSIYNHGVRRIVGDVRRVLSSRRAQGMSPPQTGHSRAQSGGSVNPRQSTLLHTEPDRPQTTSASQESTGAPRFDVLGASIAEAYKDAFDTPPTETPTLRLPIPEREETPILADPPTRSARNLDRLESRVTTGSRSILIMDDTKAPERYIPSGSPPARGLAPPSIVPRPLHRSNPDLLTKIGEPGLAIGQDDPHTTDFASHRSRRHSTDGQIRNLLAAPEPWQPDDTTAGAIEEDPQDAAHARRSSHAYPLGLHMPAIRHQLRRRPGGDLKAAENVHELQPMSRPTTSGYSTSTSRSVSTSAPYSGDFNRSHVSGRAQTYSAFLSGARGRQQSSMAQSHASQPNMRPSHLTDVAGVSRSDGIEDALMKLEGRFGSRSENLLRDRLSRPELELPRAAHFDRESKAQDFGSPTRTSTFSDDNNMLSPVLTETQGASIYHLSGTDISGDLLRQSSRMSTPTVFTQAQAPELALGATRFPIAADRSAATSPASIVREGNTPTGLRPDTPEDDRRPSSGPKSSVSQGSFLLEDDESLSEISTEMDHDAERDSLGVRSFFWDVDETGDQNVVSFQQRVEAPPTPPSTGKRSNPSAGARVGPRGPPSEPLKPLKEASSAPKLRSPTSDDSDMQQPTEELRRVRTFPDVMDASHLPFVLAFESDVIAEQLTIVEKDALDEIAWQDLIDLKWQQSPGKIRNWVEFIKGEESKSNGIDIAIARFNLAVKWVVSECVLTKDAAERARCFIKFIHIATYTHRLHNYASTYQITLALLSSDLSRLRRSWALVPAAEKATLTRLETLCQPMRNFHHLRAEMESVAVDEGCIPFIGLYTHDLMYNAQKPAKIDPSPPGGEPLINFERYQTAATIVKNLLRLLEASGKYVFHPHPEALSRCLWLAALDDHEISARSKALEQ